jgi:predicted amidohydrolase YtcJ
VHDIQPWRDELEAGVRVVISSDSDVSSYRPLDTIANAMLRRTRDGMSIGQRHRLTLEEALFAHTIDAAYAIGADDRIGSLEPTKHADLTIVAGNLRSMDAASLVELPILSTIVRGKTRFSAACE